MSSYCIQRSVSLLDCNSNVLTDHGKVQSLRKEVKGEEEADPPVPRSTLRWKKI